MTSESWGFRLQQQSIWVSWWELELLKVTTKQLEKLLRDLKLGLAERKQVGESK